jgi:hypothetical protein
MIIIRYIPEEESEWVVKKDSGTKSSPSPTMGDWATKTSIKEIFAEQIRVHRRPGIRTQDFRREI